MFRTIKCQDLPYMILPSYQGQAQIIWRRSRELLRFLDVWIYTQAHQQLIRQQNINELQTNFGHLKNGLTLFLPFWMCTRFSPIWLQWPRWTCPPTHTRESHVVFKRSHFAQRREKEQSIGPWRQLGRQVCTPYWLAATSTWFLEGRPKTS